MRRSSTVLFELIFGLSASERRFFHRFAARHGDGNKNYLKLFQLIVESKKVEEENWRKALGPQGEAGDYAVLKHYLYERLLVALSQYHTASDPIEALKRGLHEARILLQKGLLQAAAQHLKKQKTRLDRLEAWEQLPEYCLVQKQLLDRQYYAGSTAAIDDLLEMVEESQDLLKRHYNWWSTTARLAQQHYRQSSNGNGEYQELCVHLEHLGLPERMRNRFLYHRGNAVQAFNEGNIKKAHLHNKVLLDLLNERPKWKQRNAALFLSVMNNYLIDCFRLQLSEDIAVGITQMRSLNKQPAFRRLPHLESHTFRFSYMMEMNQSLRSGVIGAINDLEQAVSLGLKRNRDKIELHHRLTLQYLMAYCLFARGKFDRSLDWLALFFKLKDKAQIKDIQFAAAFLELMNHLSLENGFVIESQIRSIKKRFQVRKGKQAGIFYVLNALDRINNAIDQKHRRKELEILVEYLGEHQEDSSLQKLTNYFNLGAWLKSLLSSSSFTIELQKIYKAQKA